MRIVIKGPFVDFYKLNNFFIIGVMLWICLLSGLGVVYAKHKHRTLHIKLQSIQIERSNLNIEWSKLLLEKSTCLANHRVEWIAKNKLGMQEPEQVYIIR